MKATLSMPRIFVKTLINAFLVIPILCFAQNAQVSSYIDSADPVVQGSSLSYVATVANSDISVDASNVVLTMSVPTGSTYVAATYGPLNASCGAPAAGIVTWGWLQLPGV
jgi:hypothetical protein